MNIFLNPFITFPFIKHYIRDPGRIERLSPEQLERFRDKSFRKRISYAYTVPVYKKKYKESGIHPNDIRGIKDITKLPLISREDFSENFPDGIIPSNFNKRKGHVICTGGTTTKYCCNSGAQPVCTYTDIPTLLRGSLLSLRENRFFNLNIRTTRFAHIGNFNPFKFDEVFEKNVLSHVKTIFPAHNYLSMQASHRTKEILEKLDSFRPDVITSYPAIFQDLAFLMRKGFGSNVRPKLLLVGGAMLDDYTRHYVEDIFGCQMFNTYASCESGAEISFECTERNWHIHSDFFHLEAIDGDMEPVGPGERGRLVITKLWGGGTPIIRYTGMEDWITLGNGEKCGCGIKNPILGNSIEGRIDSNIILPNGKIFSPSEFLFITSVLNDLKTFKVKKFQIVQHSIDEIDIFLVIDEDLRHIGCSVTEIARRIKKVYQEKSGPSVAISVKEVSEIEDTHHSGKPAPIILSYVDRDASCKRSTNSSRGEN